ncbi:uncharacterized protein LOC131156781 [Malania oleifera]|uniref:uncharacterized protein LOC131156781 n=1 Tax=Malania oleifera TaxID=397392 RepID=UPI0025AE619A|nr:uncharacterized protein LOC131156781 [Malania oleifera]XP_057966715.1 uncharacterized protein LOC131156781 [Malania oleifera]XP_057966716.1 uncharacterized protein LOC131156781 [Malania oleifera]
MEEFVSPRFDGIGNAVTIRKKRSQTFRRPRPDSQLITERHDHSTSSSTPPSDDVSKLSSDENGGYDTISRRKEFNLNHCASRAVSSSKVEDEKTDRNIKGEDGGLKALYSNGGLRDGTEQRQSSNKKRCSEGVLAPANWKSTNKMKKSLESLSKNVDISGNNYENQSFRQSDIHFDGSGNESKVKKVKLKVGGVTRTIQANCTNNGAMGDGSSRKSSKSSDASHVQQKLISQENSDDNHSPLSNKRSGLQGIPWKDFSRVGFNLGKEDSLMGRIKNGDKLEPVRKSKRVPKRRIMDGAFDDDDDEDDEIRYLEKLKTSKLTAVYKDDEEELNKKQRRVSRVSRTVEGKHDDKSNDISRLGKESKKSRSVDVSEDTDYEEEDDPVSDCELEGKNRRKRPRKESVEVLMEGKREMTLTTRQRALQSGKDASAPGASLIEFPNGLPNAPSRKQKEKLSEVEQQLKKAEAAQRRRMQVEKAARESEAEAIRKILGQDSSRKKREDKMKKRREELAQEKAANALTLASNTVRWVMGPTGTTVTFPKDMGLPSIFDSKPCSYPPPREKCAGPSCTNPYKYRDSKSKLPLCSLQCYKAIQGRVSG